MKFFTKISAFGLLFLLGSFVAFASDSYYGNDNDETKWTVFPNPVADEAVTIKAEKEIRQIELLNIVGQQIQNKEIALQTSVKLDINLKSGIYLIKVTFFDDTVATKRLWVK